MSNKRIEYDIGFKVENQNLNTLQQQLQSIKRMSQDTYFKIAGTDAAISDLSKVRATASTLESALESSFNPKLNTINFEKFNSYLQNAGISIKSIQQEFSQLGNIGNQAFNNLTTTLMTTNAEIQKTKSVFSSLTDTLFNAAKWSIAYGAINKISDGIRSSWQYAVSLDSALNDIRIVTGKSYQEMEKFVKSANKAAKALGTSTMDYTKGSLIYYQQGLSDKEVAARTAVTAKAANVTGQTIQEVSEQLTAVWNGFNVSASKTEEYVDKLAAVAANSASDLEELSTGMSRVASAASTMGINIDQLTAQIATIESVTRQDAASIGTSLKTIYSRMGDLAIGAEDEFGVTLGDVSSKMKQMGIDILDSSGDMRDMGTVIEEVAAKWNTWTSAQQQAAAVAIAGKRQYNNLFALFENWDMYEANKTVSENSLGELQKQQDTYMESTAAHLEKLSATWEKLKDNLFDNESLNHFIDIWSWFVKQIGDFIESIGGIMPVLDTLFASLLKKIGPKVGPLLSQIGNSIKGVINDLKGSSNDIVTLQINAQKYIEQQYEGLSLSKTAQQKLVSLKAEELKYEKLLTAEQKEQFNLSLNRIANASNRKEQLVKEIEGYNKIVEKYGLNKGTNTENDNFFDYNKLQEGKRITNKSGQEISENQKIFDDNVRQAQDVIHSKVASIDTIKENYQKVLNVSQKDGAYKAYQVKFVEGIDTVVKTGMESLADETLTEDQKKEVENALNKFYKSITRNVRTLGDYGQRALDLEASGKGNTDEARVLKHLAKGERIDYREKAANAKNKAQATRYNNMAIYQENVLKGSYGGLSDEEKINIVQKNSEVKEAYEDLTDAIQNNNKAQEKELISVGNVGVATEEYAQKTKEAAEEQKAIIDQGKEAKFNTITEGITNLTGSVAAAAATFRNITSIFEILKSESLDTGEKVKQVIFAVIGLIAMMIPNIVSMLGMLRTQATTALGWIGLILEAISLIAALGVGIYNLIDHRSETEKLQDQLEEQKKTVDELESSIEDLKSGYEELLTTIEDYQDSRLAIDNLKAGTEEWEQAIIDLNEKALDLIETYDILASYLSVDQNGIINISDEGFEALKKEQQDELYKKQKELSFAKIATISTENQLKKQNFQDAIFENKKGNYISRNKSYTADEYDAVTGQVITKTRQAIYGTVGFDSDKYYYSGDSNWVKKEIKDIFSETQKQYQSQGESYFLSENFKELTQGLSSDEEELESLRKTLQKNITTIETNNKVLDLYYQQLAKANLEDNSSYENSLDKQAVINAYTGILKNQTDKFDVTSSTGKGTWEAWKYNSEFRKAFFEYLGVNESDVKVTYDKNKKFTVVSKATGETLYDDTWVNAYNAVNLDQKQQNINKTIDRTIANIDRIASNKDYSFLNELTGKDATSRISFSNFIQSDFDKWKKISTTDALKDQFIGEGKVFENEDVFNAFLESYGFTGTSEDALNVLLKSLQSSAEERESTNSQIASLGSQLSNSEKYTNQELKDYSNSLQKIYNANGENGQTAYDKFLNSFTTSDQVIINSIAKNIDWNSLTASSEFLSNLEAQGIKIDYNNQKYIDFINNIQDSNLALYKSVGGLKNIKDLIASINDLTKDIKIGDIISKEDFQTLFSLRPEIKKLFLETAEGYKLISNQITDDKGKTYNLNSYLNEKFSNLKDAKEYYKKYNNVVEGLDEDEISGETDDDSSLFRIIGIIRGVDPDNIVGESIGLSNDALIKLLQKLSSGEATKDDKDKLKEYVEAAKKMVKEGTVSDSEIQEIFAGMQTSLLDLNDHKDELGDAYAKARSGLVAENADKYGITSAAYEILAGKKGDKEALATLNRYAHIQEEINALETESQNLTGEQKVNSLKKQNELLTEQKDTAKELYDDQLDALGLGDQEFNSYSELEKAYQDAIREKGSNWTEEDEKGWQALKDLFLAGVEATNQIKENLLSIVDERLQVSLDFNQAKRDWIDFKQNYLKLDSEGNLVLKTSLELNKDLSIQDQVDSLKEKNKTLLEDLQNYETAIKEIWNAGDLSEEEQNNQIKEYREEEQKTIQDYQDNIKELYQLWNDGWDQVQEKADNYIASFENINDLYQSLIDLNNTLNKKININNQTSYDQMINNQTQAMEGYSLALEKAQERLAEARKLNDEKAIKTAQDAVSSAASAYAQAGSNLIDLIKQKAQDSLEDIFNTYTELSEEWNRTSAADDTFLNEVDSSLNRNQIRRKFQQAIDSADSLSAQTKIKNIMEEQLKILEEKDRLSQYEVDRANAVYELTLKQIALEESQRNASKMKLVRDSNGNLTYSFVQDEDATSKAQEELESAAANLFNIDNNKVKDSIDKYYQYISEAQQAINEAEEEGDIEKAERLNDYYFGSNGLVANLQKELKTALGNLNLSSDENNVVATSLATYIEGVKLASTDLNDLESRIETQVKDFSDKWNPMLTTIGSAVDAINKAIGDEQNNVSKFKDLKTATDDLTTYLKNTLALDLKKIDTSINDLITVISKEEKTDSTTVNWENDKKNKTFVKNGNLDLEAPPTGLIIPQKPTIKDIQKYNESFNETSVKKPFNQELIYPISDFREIGIDLALNSKIPETNTTSFNALKSTEGMVVQNVKIEATFPNATTENDIKRALDSMMNQASNRAFPSNKFGY